MSKVRVFILCFLTVSTAQAYKPSVTQRVRAKASADTSIQVTDRYGQVLETESGEGVSGFAPGQGSIEIVEEKVAEQNIEDVVLEEKSLRIPFATNSTTVPGHISLQVQNFVESIKDQDVKKVNIVGFADSRGSHDYNEKLSRARALSVKKYLKKNGLSAEMMNTVGAGEKESSNLAQSRIVEIQVVR